MPKGYNGKIMRVDLTCGQVTVEEYDEGFYRTYWGGRGFVAYFLAKEVGPTVDPLGPDNRLIFATGPLTGAPISGAGRNSVGARSPLTGGYGEGEAGGFFGAELKHAGFDAIVFQGRSPRPVYLWLNDGKAELRDATHLWGKSTLETQTALQAEVADPRARVATIGPGAENLVRFACIMNDLKHAVGRCGMGAVMGSKNLKAVVVRGTKPPELANPELVLKHAKWIAQTYKESTGVLHDLGTPQNVVGLNASGGLPTRNFRTGVFAGAQNISGETLRDSLLVDRGTCAACVIRCKRVVKVDAPWEVNPAYGGPEYETIAAVGSLCGVDDLKAVAKANELCNAYSLDTIGAGATIAFAMECFERGLITRKDTGGLDLRFGDAEAMLQCLEQIAHRQGFGRVLAEGSARAAKAIGQGAEQFAMHVKGQELPMHEPRLKQALGVGYALSPTGADHNHNIHDTGLVKPGGGMIARARAFGQSFECLPFDDLGADKMTFYTHSVNWASARNCIGICFMLPYDFAQMTEIMEGVTGWNTNLFEMMKVGERMNTLLRAYNVRLGLTAKDDTLPERFFTPLEDPTPVTAPLSREAFEKAKSFYYGAMGWDDNGVPTAGKLDELGIGWAGDQQ